MSTSRNAYSLHGYRILITRAEKQAEATRKAVEKRGGIPVLLPTIAITLRKLTEDDIEPYKPLSNYQWVVVTSANGVSGFVSNFHQLWVSLTDAERPCLAVVGDKTAKTASDHNLPVDFQPEGATAEGLGQSLPIESSNLVLFPCGDQPRMTLRNTLERRGATVHSVIVYENQPLNYDIATLQQSLECGLDAIFFSSPSTVDGLLENCLQHGLTLPSKAILGCIGSTTAEQLKQWDYMPHLIPEQKGTEPFLDTLAEQLAIKNQ